MLSFSRNFSKLPIIFGSKISTNNRKFSFQPENLKVRILFFQLYNLFLGECEFEWADGYQVDSTSWQKLENEVKINLAEECAAYCTAHEHCVAFQHVHTVRRVDVSEDYPNGIMNSRKCEFSLGTDYTGHKSVGCNEEYPCKQKKIISRSATFGIKSQYYESVASNLPAVRRVQCPSLTERKLTVRNKYLPKFQDYNSKCMKTSKLALNPRFGQLQYAFLCDHDPTGKGKSCFKDGLYKVSQRYSADTRNGKSYRHIQECYQLYLESNHT